MMNWHQNGSRADRMQSLADGDQKRRTEQRIHSDRVLSLAVHLAPNERFLIEQVFQHGLKLSDIARQQGKSRSTTQYHVKQLLKRMGNPLFRFLVVHGDVLSPAVKRTGELVIHQGQSLRRVADELGLTLHTVRQHLDTIKSLARI